jgi:spore coat polysaccharide biosynthesis protein SpsF
MGCTAVVLQARLDSARLPGKALLPLGGKPLLFRVMEALKRVKADIRILASPEDCTASLGSLAAEAGFEFLAGPKDDVLGRYCLAVRRFGIGRVIRATGDNPFVFADAADAINAEASSLDADYAAYAGLPCGAGVESVAAAALLRAGEEASAPFDREHVCPYLYNHPETFLLHRPLAPLRWRGPSIRVTVDTGEDYRRSRALYGALDREASGSSGPESRYRGETVIAAALLSLHQAVPELP